MTEKRDPNYDNRVGTELNPEFADKKDSNRKQKIAIFLIMVFCLLCGFQLATQLTAKAFGYHKALGFNIGGWYFPFEFLLWAQNWGQKWPQIFNKGYSIIFLSTLPALLIAFYMKWKAGMTLKGNEFKHGSAHWASLKDIMSAALLPEVDPKKLNFDQLEWAYKDNSFPVKTRAQRARKKAWEKKHPFAKADPEREGVFVGAWEDKKKELHYLRDNGPTHVLMVAPTRSGKGVGPVNDTVLTWRESMFVYDIKGELWALTSGWRHSIGNTCIRFEPAKFRVNLNQGKTDAKGNPLPPLFNTARWNPFDEIRSEGSEEYYYDFETKKCGVRPCLGENEIADAQNTMTLIVDPDGKGLDDHWIATAFALLVGAVIHLKHNLPDLCSPQTLDLMLSGLINFKTLREMRKRGEWPEHPTMDDLFKVLNQGSGGEGGSQKSNSMAVLYADMKEGKDINDKPYKANKAAMTAGTDQYARPDEEAGSVLSTAKRVLNLYRDPTVAENTSHSDFRIAQLMNLEQPVSLYMVTQPADKDRLRPLVRLLVNSVIRLLAADMKFKGGRSVQGYKHRLLLMLDEFPSLKKLDILQEALAYIAGYGMKAFLITQDMVQLRDVYGQNESVSANCHISMWYAPLNNETAKLMSEKVGTTTLVDENISISGSGFKASKSRSIQETGRALLTPDECMTLPGAVKDADGNILKAGAMVICPSGKPAIHGLQPLYFKNPILIDRAKISALPYSEITVFSGDKSDKALQDEILKKAREKLEQERKEKQQEPPAAEKDQESENGEETLADRLKKNPAPQTQDSPGNRQEEEKAQDEPREETLAERIKRRALEKAAAEKNKPRRKRPVTKPKEKSWQDIFDEEEK